MKLASDNNKVIDAFPLSNMQSGMYYHYLLEERETLYHDVFRFSIECQWNLNAFIEAIQVVLSRHPILRTAFEFEKFSEPMQLIYKQGVSRFELIEAQKMSAFDYQTFISQRIQSLQQNAFDLSQPSLIRFTVVQSRADKFDLLVDAHHMILDGWSMAVLLTELFQTYLKQLGLTDADLSVLPNNYLFKEFVKQERALITDPLAISYWSTYLSGFDYQPLKLGEVDSVGELKTIEFEIESQLSQALRQCAVSSKTSLRTVLLAAHLRTCAFIQGSNKGASLVVNNSRLEQLGGDTAVGLFVNSLPYAIELTNLSWNELFIAIDGTQTQHYRYRAYPIAQMIKAQGNPLSDILFNYVYFHVYKNIQGVDGFEVTDARIEEKNNAGLAITFVQGLQGNIKVLLQYDSRSVAHQQIEALTAYLNNALRVVVAETQNPCLNDTLMSEPEQINVIAQSRAAAQVPLVSSTLNELLTTSAKKFSTRTALEFNNHLMTYQELDTAADQVARFLRGRGINRGDLVGVCLERSFDLIVVIIGIIKSGGACLPLDVSLPEERKHKIVEDAAPKLCVVQDSSEARLEAFTSVIDLAQLKSALDSPHLAVDLNYSNLDVRASDPLYCLYTSGTTGKPKGVVMSHQAITNLVFAQVQHNPLLGQSMRTLQFASVGFDVSFQELITTLIWGGTLCLISEQQRKDIYQLPQFIQEHHIERLFVPYAALKIFCMSALDYAEQQWPLKLIVTAGEQLQMTAELVKWLSLIPNVMLDNHYGPTETHVAVTYHNSNPVSSWAFLPPIGKPLANCEAWVLNQQLSLLPNGVVGELYLGGVCLADGYLNSPEQTAEKFIAHPYTSDPKARLYKTGDLVRRLNDGNLEFIGRIDDQIKVRGYRVELAEIEHQLNQLEYVNDALVLAQKDSLGFNQLVAYVVTSHAAKTGSGEHELIKTILGQLAKKLPEYMVPTAVTLLERWPLTANGKLDKRALPIIDVLQNRSPQVPPKGELQNALVTIWSELLAIPHESLGVNDNFFALGGHSLLTVRLVAKINKLLKLQVKLQDIFEYPTIAKLADELTAREANELTEIKSVKRTSVSYPLSFAQQRLWFIDKLQQGSANYNMPARIDIEGPFDVGIAQQAINHLIQRHEILRTYFIEEHDQARQVINEQGELGIITHDFSLMLPSLREEKILTVCNEESHRIFDLSRPPLIRVQWIACSNSSGVLLFNMHHIASDGWSIGVLIKEFGELYQAISAHQKPCLLELPLQYLDYALWQREYLQGDVHYQQLDYWKSQLADAPITHNLPLDFNRGERAEVGTNFYHATLPVGLHGKIQQFVQHHQLTDFMFFHGALVVLIAKYSSVNDVVIGTAVANRLRTELENLVGCFVNMLALRTQLNPELRVAEFFAHIKQINIGAQSHQDIPFEHLLEHIQVPRATMHAPLCQILLSINNLPSTSLNIAGLTLKTTAVQQPTKFDLDIEVDPAQSRITWQFDSSLFSLDTIQQLASLYENVLLALLDDQLYLRQISLLSAEQKSQLIAPLSKREKPAAMQLQAAFEHYADLAPHAIALVCGQNTWTYGELNNKSNQLAHFLGQYNFSQDERIAVVCGRNEYALIAMLAILKAGAAYVPIDSSLPIKRVKYLLDKADIRMVLTETRYAHQTTAYAHQDVVCVDETHLFEQQPVGNPEQVNVTPNNLAYVIFTSGSTGQPKGVMIEHHSISQHIYSLGRSLGVTQNDKYLLFASLAFDASIEQIFLPFSVGARCVILDDNQIAPHELVKILKSQQISVLDIPPAYWRECLSTPVLEQLPLTDVHTIILGGEAFPLGSFPSIEHKFPALHSVYNAYGPTETTVTALIKRFDKNEVAQLTHASLGEPFDDTQVWTFDLDGNLLPSGAVGELYISGDRLARGYLDDPEQTAMSFGEPPELSGVRIYRTGDLVRKTLAGDLHFYGRIDDQIKLRGFRIEIAEIEAQLNHLPEVVKCAVVFQNKDHAPTLVAYIQVHSTMALTPEQAKISIRGKLNQYLPSYMIPGDFVVVEHWPTTQSGKTDLARLKAIVRADNTTGVVPARTDLEQALVDLYKDILAIDELGIEDSFFELGGHSILAVRLVNRIANDLSRSLSLRQLMDNPRIVDLANIINQQTDSKAFVGEPLPPLAVDRANQYQPFPLTGIQKSYFMGRRSDFALGNVGAYGYTEISAAQLDVQRVETAWNRLVQRHDMLRMVVNAQGEQEILPRVPEYKIKFYDISSHPLQDKLVHLSDIRAAMSHQVFSGMEWPLFDLRVTQVSAQEALLHIGTDALAMDASSTILIEKEFYQLYHHPEAELPAINFTFRDYVLALKRQESSPAFIQAKNYWLEQITEFPFAPALPVAVDPSSIDTPAFERRTINVAKQKWLRIKTFAAKHEITPTALVLGCFAKVVNQWAEQAEFALNLTLFNRQPIHPAIENVVGDFTALTLLKFSATTLQAPLLECLKLTQQQLWMDLEHSSYDGTELLTDLMRHHGRIVSYPMVFTSTLGLESAADIQGFEQPASSILGETGFSISQTSQVWLDCQVSEADGNLQCVWDSVVGLFPARMLDDMISSLHSLLMQVDADASAQQYVDLPRWQHELITAINATAKELPQGLLHSPILHAMQKYPEKLAVYTRQCQLSYADLDLRSQHLAGELQANGCQANELIAIVMEKGWQQMVAVLGVLRAGSAYLPIDAALPEARIQLLLESGNVRQLVTTEEHLSKISTQVIVHCISKNIKNPTELKKSFIETAVDVSDLAYVIFTSGSTGIPKGVMIDHAGARNTIEDLNMRLAVTAKDTVFGLSNLNFDLSVYDIFGVLGAGGCILIPDAKEYRDPAAWLHYLLPDNAEIPPVTIWNTVPALMQMLVEYVLSNPLDAGPLFLRAALLSGDWIPIDLPGKIWSCFKPDYLFSLGGATEASIWSIFYPIQPGEQFIASVPYGKPLSNQKFYVLKSDLSLAPVEVAGDLYIAGVGLAKGYKGDTEKTETSFIYHQGLQTKLYKTGDKGRLRSDGQIEFLGREDFQVKVQGYRVELGEIEARLKKHPLVNEAFVSTYQQTGQTNLVAYYTDSLGYPIDDAAKLIDFKHHNQAIRSFGSSDGLAIEGSKQLSFTQSDMQFQKSTALTFDVAKKMLQGLCRHHTDSTLIPKAFYPSAGSTYAVQTFVYIPQTLGWIDAMDKSIFGVFYFNPLEWKLYQVSHWNVNCEHFAFIFVGEYGAIEPVYQANSKRFLEIEAGYMAGLVNKLCPAPYHLLTQPIHKLSEMSQKLNLTTTQDILSIYQMELDTKIDSSPAVVQVSEDSTYRLPSITPSFPETLSLWQRKSYRNYLFKPCTDKQLNNVLSAIRNVALTGGPVQPISIYIQVNQPIGVGENEIGSATYRYEWIHHSLALVGTAKLNVFSGENWVIAEHAAFNIFFVSDALNTTEVIGQLAQAALLGGLMANIGMCPMGTVDADRIKAIIPDLASATVIHSLTCGVIDTAEITSEANSNPKPLNITQVLKSHLASQLPDYMVPRHFVAMKQLPLTNNGKIDRAALPSPQQEQQGEVITVEFTGPAKILGDIWCDVLGVNQLKSNDNFFNLGGHSLAAVRLTTQIKEQLGVDLSITRVFEAPVFSAMVDEIETKLRDLSMLEQVVVQHKVDNEQDDTESTLWI